MILCEALFVSNYKTEARSRWGNTDAYREHEQKTNLLRKVNRFYENY